MPDSNNKKTFGELTPQECSLIKIIRELKYGEVRIVVTEGKPTRIEEIKKSIKL